MIWDRERYLAHCNFEYTGREMFCELFGPLIGLEDEWKLQGADREELELVAFDWDYVLKTSIHANCSAMSGITPHILEEDDRHILSIDNMGRTVKLCKGSATIPLPMGYPVSTMDDWLKIKHWYTFDEKRIDYDMVRQQKALHDKGYLTILNVPGGFDEPRQLMGEEELCVACYDQPELLTDILGTIAGTCKEVIERVSAIVPIDCISIHEDMAGKSGPLFGPRQVEAFMKPYYKTVWSCAKQQGARLFSQDSDGNMNSIIENMMDCGINCMFPCEPAAGMDMVKIREKFKSNLVLKGGIDKFVLRKSKEDIRKELEYKMSEPMLRGGTIFALDHRIPNGVPLENYRFYVNKGREILGLPPVSEKGWERMAF